MLELLSVLAVWRITSILHQEDGPYSVIKKFRESLGQSELKNMLDCFWCTSFWVALPFAFIFHYWIIYWLSLSAGAILIEEVRERL
jgi:hypothetical protein